MAKLTDVPILDLSLLVLVVLLPPAVVLSLLLGIVLLVLLPPAVTAATAATAAAATALEENLTLDGIGGTRVGCDDDNGSSTETVGCSVAVAVAASIIGSFVVVVVEFICCFLSMIFADWETLIEAGEISLLLLLLIV